jgi:hypothetical protein
MYNGNQPVIPSAQPTLPPLSCQAEGLTDIRLYGCGPPRNHHTNEAEGLTEIRLDGCRPSRNHHTNEAEGLTDISRWRQPPD